MFLESWDRALNPLKAKHQGTNCAQSFSDTPLDDDDSDEVIARQVDKANTLTLTLLCVVDDTVEASLHVAKSSRPTKRRTPPSVCQCADSLAR